MWPELLLLNFSNTSYGQGTAILLQTSSSWISKYRMTLPSAVANEVDELLKFVMTYNQGGEARP
jgi:hypothetical protein